MRQVAATLSRSMVLNTALYTQRTVLGEFLAYEFNILARTGRAKGCTGSNTANGVHIFQWKTPQRDSVVYNRTAPAPLPRPAAVCPITSSPALPCLSPYCPTLVLLFLLLPFFRLPASFTHPTPTLPLTYCQTSLPQTSLLRPPLPCPIIFLSTYCCLFA